LELKQEFCFDIKECKLSAVLTPTATLINILLRSVCELLRISEENYCLSENDFPLSRQQTEEVRLVSAIFAGRQCHSCPHQQWLRCV